MAFTKEEKEKILYKALDKFYGKFLMLMRSCRGDDSAWAWVKQNYPEEACDIRNEEIRSWVDGLHCGALAMIRVIYGIDSAETQEEIDMAIEYFPNLDD